MTLYVWKRTREIDPKPVAGMGILVLIFSLAVLAVAGTDNICTVCCAPLAFFLVIAFALWGTGWRQGGVWRRDFPVDASHAASNIQWAFDQRGIAYEELPMGSNEGFREPNSTWDAKMVGSSIYLKVSGFGGWARVSVGREDGSNRQSIKMMMDFVDTALNG